MTCPCQTSLCFDMPYHSPLLLLPIWIRWRVDEPRIKELELKSLIFLVMDYFRHQIFHKHTAVLLAREYWK
jgi:hypothetical protein